MAMIVTNVILWVFRKIFYYSKMIFEINTRNLQDLLRIFLFLQLVFYFNFVLIFY